MKLSSVSIIAILLLSLFSKSYAQDSSEQYTVGVTLWFLNESFFDEMEQLGYIEGENITYQVLSFDEVPPEEFFNSYNQQVQTMIDSQVDAIFTNTDTDAVMIGNLTQDIPIVFGRSDDPVATGAVESLITPGGNLTGVITNRPHERRLQVLLEIKPETKKIYYLYGTFSLEGEAVLQQVQIVAAELGIEVVPAPITDLASALELLENTPEDIDWLFLTPYTPFDLEFFEKLNSVSSELKVGIAGVTDLATQGYLMGYGPNIDDSNRQAAQIVDRILRGANPADLPVQTAENFLMINLETAEWLGVEIPLSILQQARTISRPGDFDNLTIGDGNN